MALIQIAPQPTLDATLEAAAIAMQEMPADTAVIQYHGAKAEVRITTDLKACKAGILKKLNSPKGETEEQRTARLEAEGLEADEKMMVLLNEYENLISKNCHYERFMFANWVAKAAELLTHPKLGFWTKQRFSTVMHSYSALVQPLAKYNSNTYPLEPHTQARLMAMSFVHDAMLSIAQNKLIELDEPFSKTVDRLRDQQEALDAQRQTAC